mgnify:CR=1 FL=1
MKENDRLRSYAAQIGVDSKGAFKNGTTKNRLMEKLTGPQRKRAQKKSKVSV